MGEKGHCKVSVFNIITEIYIFVIIQGWRFVHWKPSDMLSTWLSSSKGIPFQTFPSIKLQVGLFPNLYVFFLIHFSCDLDYL